VQTVVHQGRERRPERVWVFLLPMLVMLCGTIAHAAEGAGASVIEAPADTPAISAAPPAASLQEVLGSTGGAAPAGATPTGLVGGESASLVSLGRSNPGAPSDNVNRWGTEASISDSDFDYSALPGRLSSDRLRPLWRDGLELERADRLVESAARYEIIVSEVPEQSYTYWRIARNYWRTGEGLPAESKDERIVYFELAESWAGRGISIDPECAPCMLWKFVSMGRQATTRGLMSAVGDVGEMDDLLTRGIELQPDHADNAGNATLGNLYYSGAVFYRVVPDWWWLKLFIGVSGDKERSLDYARRAVAISSLRVDYRVELGAVLLCVGVEEDRPEATLEGMGVLAEAQGLDDFLSTDYLDKAHAAILMESPEKACGYSRDGFIDLDSLEAEARTRR
jgi:hypothetical protein